MIIISVFSVRLHCERNVNDKFQVSTPGSFEEIVMRQWVVLRLYTYNKLAGAPQLRSRYSHESRVIIISLLSRWLHHERNIISLANFKSIGPIILEKFWRKENIKYSLYHITSQQVKVFFSIQTGPPRFILLAFEFRKISS